MSQAKHVYRNVKNGRTGELTEDQARIWPDLLVRVVEEPIEVEPVTPVEPQVVEPTEAPSPAPITKKKD